MPNTSDILRFDGFELDTANRQLRRDGAPVELGSRYFDALVLLVREAGALVPKDRFMEEVWRGIPVTDEALTQAVRTLRRALGDDAANPRYIQTVPKHGYRFLVAPTAAPAETRVRQSEPGPPSRGGGRIAGAATLGGGAAGVLAGLAYGLAATSGGSGAVVVLAALVGALGLLAGAGLGLGMGVAVEVRRHAGWGALVAGGAIGGALVGTLGQVLGRDGIAALTGAALGPTTGLFEGAVLGAAVGLAAWLGQRANMVRAGLAGALLGAGAGLAIALADGRLLAASLLAVERRFPASQLALARLDAVGMIVLTMFEGAVFVACLAMALALAQAGWQATAR